MNTHNDPSDLLFGPYVTGVSETAATALWLPAADAASPGRLRFRAAANEPWREASVRAIVFPPGPEILCAADLSALAPGRTVDYELELGGARVAGSFSTPPPRGSRDPFRFILYGDNRSGPERHTEVLRGAFRDLPFVFISNTGDLTANAASWRQWKQEFFGPGRDVFRQTAVWAVRGNHEVDGILYRAFFDRPDAACYYSLDAGNLHYIVLDSELLDFDRDPAAHQRMVQWLERDLATCRADWIISASHVPIFNIGGDGSAWGRTDVLGVLERHGVDIHIASHSHLYERFRPIGPAGGKPIIHLVSGGAGGPAYELRPSPILAKNYTGLHYCLFEADGLRLDMTVKAPDGAVVDRLTLDKRTGRSDPALRTDALTTTEATELAFVSSARLAVDFVELPAPGRATRAALRLHDRLPAAAQVRIETDPESGWTTPGGVFDAGAQPFELEIRAPDTLTLHSGFVRPPLRLRRTVSLRGRTFEGGATAPSLTESTVRRLIPEPVPVPVPRAPDGWRVDGDFVKWRGVSPMALAGRDGRSRAVRVAWTTEGLFGAFWDAVANEAEPRGTSLEVYIESDFGRARNGHHAPHAASYAFRPADDGVRAGSSYGPLRQRPGDLAAARGAVEGATAIEFRIPAAALAPAGMTTGATLGFHYRLWAGPQLVEEFLDTEGKPAVWITPLYWGAIRLTA